MDLTKLEELARLTGGCEWKTEVPREATGRLHGHHVWRLDGDAVARCFDNIGNMPEPVDGSDVADYIATANPAVVLDLIALIRKQEADLALARQAVDLSALHRYDIGEYGPCFAPNDGSYVLYDDLVALLAAAPTEIPAQAGTLICPNCKTDRLKDPCPKTVHECPMIGHAQAALSDDRAAFENFWTNPHHGDNSSIDWHESDGYFSFLTREAYRSWQAGRAVLIAQSNNEIRHDTLFEVYSDTLKKLGYTSIEADSNGLMAVANYAILAASQQPAAAPTEQAGAQGKPAVTVDTPEPFHIPHITSRGDVFMLSSEAMAHTARAVAEERDRCSKLAMQWGMARMPEGGGNALFNFAAAIRLGVPIDERDTDYHWSKSPVVAQPSQPAGAEPVGEVLGVWHRHGQAVISLPDPSTVTVGQPFYPAPPAAVQSTHELRNALTELATAQQKLVDANAEITAMNLAASAKQSEDDKAVNRFAAAMKHKMYTKKLEGRGGWEDEKNCRERDLQQMLLDHLAKGDPVDIGNFAMMLWNRGEKVVAPQSDSERDAALAEFERLNAIINTPQSNDFLRSVSTEAEHQRQRWGNDHDAGKAPSDWFWLVGYLAGKALNAHAAGNTEKAEHHIITTAAALANWHLSMFGKTNMRAGIHGDAAMAAAASQTREG